MRTTTWEVVYIVGPRRETKVGEQMEAAAGVQVWVIVCIWGRCESGTQRPGGGRVSGPGALLSESEHHHQGPEPRWAGHGCNAGGVRGSPFGCKSTELRFGPVWVWGFHRTSLTHFTSRSRGPASWRGAWQVGLGGTNMQIRPVWPGKSWDREGMGWVRSPAVSPGQVGGVAHQQEEAERVKQGKAGSRGRLCVSGLLPSSLAGTYPCT